MKKLQPILLATIFFCSCSPIVRLYVQNKLSKGEINAPTYPYRLKIDDSSGWIVLKTKSPVNDKELNLVFDTGGDICLLTTEAAKALNVKIAIPDDYDSTKGIGYCSSIMIDSLYLNNFAYGIADLPFIDCDNIDGVIGGNVFRKAYWLIDFDNKEITVSDNIKHFALDNTWNEIPFHYSKGINIGYKAYITLEVNGEKKELVFDSGANSMIMQIDETWTSATNPFPKRDFITSDSINGKIVNIENIKFGNFKINHYQAWQTNDTSDVIALPNFFIKQFNLVLDYHKRKIYFKPNQQFIDDVSLMYYGYFLDNYDINSTKALIVELVKDSPTEKAGIQLNDQVIGYNGNKNMSYHDIMCFEGHRGQNQEDSEIIHILRNDTILDISLKKERLFE